MLRWVVWCLVALLCGCRDHPVRYNGYFDADLTYLSSDFAGRLMHLNVHRGESVQKGQLLFNLEQVHERFSLDISQLNQRALLAQKQQIDAQLHYNQMNHDRTRRIRTGDAASQNDLDVATEELAVSKQQLAAIEAQIQSAQVDSADKRWVIARKASHAPDAGIVYDTYYTPNEWVQGGQPVLSLVTRKHIKVIFFAPERDLPQIRTGQRVTISSDDNVTLARGRISYVSNVAQYTPPIIYSREQSHKLIFRIEARIDSPRLEQIHLGQPVSIELQR